MIQISDTEMERHMQAYLDNSSTTRQSRASVDAMVKAAETDYGNPSSLHRLGMASEKIMKASRKKAAGAAGADADEIYFVSGGTEADNTAVFGAAGTLGKQGNKIITTEIEHPAVLEACRVLESRGFEVVYLPVDSNGVADMDAFDRELDDRTILVSVMHVNNETGSVQPVAEIGRRVKKQGLAVFHCDAVQSYGKLPVDVHSWGIDMLSASGHKIHGPKGSGIFYLRKNLHIPPLVYGGGQEKGMRSGTENVPGAAGFAAALSGSDEEMLRKLDKVRSLSLRLRERILSEIPDVTVNSPAEAAEKDAGIWLPYILNVTFRGCRSEVLLHMLEQSEIYVSTGSACSTHKKGFSHVLKAMGRSDADAEGALRFSLSSFTEPEEIEYTVDKLKTAVEQHRKMMNIAHRMGR